MSPFFKLISSVKKYKGYTVLSIVFHLLTALLTVVSIPLVIPFFQILFGISPSEYEPPQSIWDLEAALNYGFSRLIAMTDHLIALKIICIIVVVVFLLKNLFRYLISYFMIYVRNGILRDLRLTIWECYESQSLAQRYEKKQGYLISLITNDLSEVDHGILKVFELLFKTPLIIIGSLIFMIWLSPRLTIIAILLVLFTLFVIGGVSHILKRQSAKAQGTLSVITTLVDQYLSATKLIRTHHAEGYFKRKFNENNEGYFDISNKIFRRRDLASPLAEFFGVVTIVILLYYGTHAVFDEIMEPATFFAFIFAFYNIIDPAKSFSREYANVQRGMAALERIEQFKKDSTISLPIISGTQKAVFSQAITLEKIRFAYDDHIDVLKDLSLTIKKGERIGIIGSSGMGKTTILDLILGFYGAQEGSIRLDGLPINAYEVTSYRSLFGLVTQHPVLFHGSIRDNILLDQEMNESRLIEVFNTVDLPLSFLNKKIGDQATKLSGGESQRVSLARLLYRSPEIFLLDEPSSQLDFVSEHELIDQLLNATRGKTIIIITHQVELLKDMDRILILNEGRIVDKGQYEALYDRNDVFRKLIGEGNRLNMS